MKKLKLDLAQIQVVSFAATATNGGGTVNAYDTNNTDVDCDGFYGTTTLKNTDCVSCPYCLDEPIGPP